MALQPIDFYDAKKWEINENRELEHRENQALEYIRNTIESGAKILDVGCGDGQFLNALESRTDDSNIDYYGVDYSKYKIEKASKLYHKKHFKFCNLETGIPHKDAMFDVVYSGEVIEHIYNPDFMLEECNRVMKTGGILIITTPNLQTWYNRILFLFGVQPIFYETSVKSAKNGAGILRKLKQQEVPVGHIRLFNKTALKDIVEREGFEIIGFKGAIFHGLPRPVRTIDKVISHIPSLASNLIIIARKI